MTSAQAMQKSAVQCTTCGSNLVGAEDTVRFKCPKCAAVEIVRCRSCRVLKNKYTCRECDFVGP